MIEIIKPGTKKRCTCMNCGCLFTYEEEDIIWKETKVFGGGYQPKTSVIECPQCKIEIVLETSR